MPNVSRATTRAGIYRAVFEGKLARTPGGLTKSDLMVSPNSGKIVSKQKYRNGVKQMRQLRASGLAAEPYTAANGSRKSKRKARKTSRRPTKRSKRKSKKR